MDHPDDLDSVGERAIKDDVGLDQTTAQLGGKFTTVPAHERKFRQEAALLLEVRLEAVGQIRTARAKEKENLDQIEFGLFGSEDPRHQDYCP